jgi:ribose transport system substrate-binding protein
MWITTYVSGTCRTDRLGEPMTHSFNSMPVTSGARRSEDDSGRTKEVPVLRTRIAAVLTAALAFTAACSAEDTTISDSDIDKDGLAIAQDAVDKNSEAPQSLGLEEKLGALPTGKTVYEIEFPGPVGQVVGDSVDAACERLGCDVTRVPMGLDPASQAAAWDRAVRDRPDVVVSAGVTTALVGPQMRELRELGVKVVVFISDGVEGSDVDVNLAGPDRMGADGVLQADWIAADSGGKAHVLAIDFPDLPYTEPWTAAVKDEVGETCPSCTVAVEHYGFAVAEQFPGRVVSFLQQHPEVNYIAMTYGDQVVGLPQALSAAGLDDQVTIVGRAGTSVNYELIANDGPQKADIGFPVRLFSWGLVDTAARLLAGQDASAPYRNITQVLTNDTITFDPANTPSWAGVGDFEQQFEESWGVSQ